MTTTSTTPKPVVVGVDGTDGCTGALRYAATQATRQGAALHLLHVEPSYLPMTPMLPFYPGDVESVASTILEKAAREVRRTDSSLLVTTTIGIGATSQELAQASENASLLVVGHDTRHGLDRWWHGDMAVRAAARAHCAVAVVPQDWEPGAAPRGRVAVGLRSSAHADETLGHGFAAAEAAGATLVVVHAWDLKDPYLDRIEARTHGEEWEEDGRRLVEQSLADWRAVFPGVPVEVRVEHGVPAEVLTRAAADADLVVLARRATALQPDGHLGTTARAVVRRCPSLVVVHPAGTVVDRPPALRLENSGALVR